MKTAVNVDRKVLLDCIATSEYKGPLANRSALYERVHAVYQQVKPDPKVTISVIMLRITKENIPVLTPVGKRGRVKGQKIVGGVRTKRKDKMNKYSIDVLKQSIPPQYISLADKILDGSIKAAIKLNCLSCVGFERTVKVDDSDAKGIDQIGECTVMACPMWNFRPYQKG